MHVNTACIFEFAICHYGLVIQHLHFSFVNPDQGFDGVIARGHGFEPFRQLRQRRFAPQNPPGGRRNVFGPDFYLPCRMAAFTPAVYEGGRWPQTLVAPDRGLCCRGDGDREVALHLCSKPGERGL
jgi:hypothetical protein